METFNWTPNRQSMTFYVCDRKKCPNCSEECKHTSDITHALYDKHKYFYHDWKHDLWEVIQEEKR